MDNEDLNKQIELLREQMISVGTLKGFTFPETIKLSKKLDKLLNQLNKRRDFSGFLQ